MRRRLRVLGFTLAFDVSPHRHDGVANELIESAVVLKNDIGHRAQVFIQLPDQFLRIGFLAHGGETDDVRKKNRRRHARTFERVVVAAGILQNFFDQILGNVTLERASSAQLFHALNRVIDPEGADATEQKSREYGNGCENETGAIVGEAGNREINHGDCDERDQRKNWAPQKRNHAPPNHPRRQNQTEHHARRCLPQKFVRLSRRHYLQMNGRTGSGRIHWGDDEVVGDLRRGSNNYDFIFKNCAVGVVRFPKARMENLPERERWVSIIGAKTEKMIALILWNISAVSKFR